MVGERDQSRKVIEVRKPNMHKLTCNLRFMGVYYMCKAAGSILNLVEVVNELGPLFLLLFQCHVVSVWMFGNVIRFGIQNVFDILFRHLLN